MATASPLLPLFKEQLESECATLSAAHSLTERGHSLIYWYFMRLHDFTASEVEEVFCDGGGDLGIDAIWIDDEEIVHFYQFKNPEDPAKGIPAGDVDKVLAGLRLILLKQHGSVANPELKERVEEIYQRVNSGYRLHLVSSGKGIQKESELKLEALAAELSGPSSTIFDWKVESIAQLQDRFYQQSLPAVRDPIRFELASPPYMLRSGVADCYSFHTSGAILANLYKEWGEGLLQRNIRVDQRDTATNRSIEATCASDESVNFIHFNNGVTFLCETAVHDGFQHQLSLEKAQIVNGGQTVRALFRASQKGSLKADVLVPIRAITSSGDKDFANNVAVNQNNQNQMGTGFLRSNDPRVIQLDHSLAALGWYLERREGEIKNATVEEKAVIQRRIGRPLEGRIIKLKDGSQAYTATFFGQPELAKKNAKKMFLSIDDGGQFERIFSAEMTAEKIVIAHVLKEFVDEFVKQYLSIRRKFYGTNEGKLLLETLLSPKTVASFSDRVHQVMPQCSVFLCGTMFKDYRDFQKKDPSQLPDYLKTDGIQLIQDHVFRIMEFAQKNQSKADKSWPVLLKSNTFFSHVVTYLQGIRSQG